MKLLQALLRLILRPDKDKLAKEVARAGEEIWEQIMFHEISEEHVDRAFKCRGQAIRTENTTKMLEEIFDIYSKQFTGMIQTRGILLKATLLPTEQHLGWLDEKKAIKDQIFGMAPQILILKLINAMAEKDFVRTMGMTREEWEKHYTGDKIDQTIEAIKNKQPLPEDIQKALKEVDGIVPFDLSDYEVIN
jgi:hypothetical protein